MYIIIKFSFFFPKKDRDKMVKIFRKCMYARKKIPNPDKNCADQTDYCA